MNELLAAFAVLCIMLIAGIGYCMFSAGVLLLADFIFGTALFTAPCVVVLAIVLLLFRMVTIRWSE